MMLLAVTMVALAQVEPQLSTADVLIDLVPNGATVVASYRVIPSADSIRFGAIRLRHQAIRSISVDDGSVEVSRAELDGMVGVSVRADSGEPNVVQLRYSVVGRLSRVPIFVPDTPTEPGASNIRIEVRGSPPNAVLGDAFPRLRLDSGVLVATPENLPSFVRLPPPRGTFSVNRLAERSVILLLVLASVAWVVRAARRARARVESQAA